MLMDSVLLASGLAALFAGGDRLVHGATMLARAVGLSPLVIGLTVVAFGTSAPELAASLAAALGGAPAVAFGNVVGSNVANLGLILGLAALLVPVTSGARFLRREMPFLLLTALLVPLLLVDGRAGRPDGVVLLLLLALYLWVLLRSKGEPAAVAAEFEEAYGDGRRRARAGALWSAAGLVLLVLGARLMVTGAVGLAREAGIAERVIGLTVVAVGTSLPELASSLVAALRREGDIVLGNVVGSNIFNVLGILGVTALARPLPVQLAAAWPDLAVMLAFTLLAWPFVASRLRLERWEGAVLLAGYGVYVAWLFIA